MENNPNFNFEYDIYKLVNDKNKNIYQNLNFLQKQILFLN